tara:strand:- start:8154 stop:8492 length:339 start_codon:yes stop_codon:yes gene_type:complete
MRLKEGVRLTGLSVELLVGIIIVDDIFRQDGKELVLTSISDGKHSFKSLHYSGNAVDIRIWDLTKSEAYKITVKANLLLGDDFDIVLELTDDGELSHIHMEYQPKTPLELRT